MSKSFVVVGVFLLTAGVALAQDEDFPRIETSPEFMYIHTPVSFTVPGYSANESFNCAGAGGTFTYNLTRILGLEADTGGCKYFGNTLNAPAFSDGHAFTFLFGPHLAFRNSSRFQPFTDLNFGGMRIRIKCTNDANHICPGNPSWSTNAFAMTVGGGFDIRMTRKISLRLIQAEYLYTRFGNDCRFPQCSYNNNQNSFLLKSGFVIGWGEAPSELCPFCAGFNISSNELFRWRMALRSWSSSNGSWPQRPLPIVRGL